MDNEGFKIYVDRLHSGHVETIRENFDAAFLEQNSEDLAYTQEVALRGEAYVAEEELVIHLDVNTIATIPCKICNRPVEIPVDLKNLYLVEPLKNAKSGIFNFGGLLREAILLEAPTFAECCHGNCPERNVIADFFTVPSKEEKGENGSDDEGGYRPFANLEL